MNNNFYIYKQYVDEKIDTLNIESQPRDKWQQDHMELNT